MFDDEYDWDDDDYEDKEEADKEAKLSAIQDKYAAINTTDKYAKPRYVALWQQECSRGVCEEPSLYVYYWLPSDADDQEVDLFERALYALALRMNVTDNLWRLCDAAQEANLDDASWQRDLAKRAVAHGMDNLDGPDPEGALSLVSDVVLAVWDAFPWSPKQNQNRRGATRFFVTVEEGEPDAMRDFSGSTTSSNLRYTYYWNDSTSDESLVRFLRDCGNWTRDEIKKMVQVTSRQPLPEPDTHDVWEMRQDKAMQKMPFLIEHRHEEAVQQSPQSLFYRSDWRNELDVPNVAHQQPLTFGSVAGSLYRSNMPWMTINEAVHIQEE